MLGHVRVAYVDRVEAVDDVLELVRHEVVERADLVLDELLAPAAAREVAVDQPARERVVLGLLLLASALLLLIVGTYVVIFVV